MAAGLVPFELEPDEHALRMRAPLSQRFAPDKVVLLVGRHREADPGLERIRLVVELVAGEDEARLDPQHVERLQPERHEPRRPARFQHRIPHSGGILRMTEQLVAELAGVPRARRDQRNPLRPAEPRDREAEPFQLCERRLRRRRPDDLRQDVARRRPLHRDVVQVVRRVLHPRLQPQPLGLFAKPDPVVVARADEAEVVGAEPEDRAVVDHPARLGAQRGVDDLTVREPADVARHRRLQQRLRVRSEDLELTQRGQVHDGRFLATGPVLGDRTKIVVRGR